MDWLRQRPIAHRGLHSSSKPENTHAAFEAAIENGYPIECDIRLTADGVPVVFHDRTLKRLTDRAAPIASLPWKSVSTLTVGNTEQSIPKLASVLDGVNGQVPLLLELKTTGDTAGLAPAVADELNSYDGPFAIQSFDPFILRWFRRHQPDWPRGQLAGFLDGMKLTPLRRLLLRWLLVTWISKPDFIAYEHQHLPYWPVGRRRKRGIPVLAWTVRSQKDWDRLGNHVDNIIFEDFEP